MGTLSWFITSDKVLYTRLVRHTNMAIKSTVLEFYYVY